MATLRIFKNPEISSPGISNYDFTNKADYTGASKLWNKVRDMYPDKFRYKSDKVLLALSEKNITFDEARFILAWLVLFQTGVVQLTEK